MSAPGTRWGIVALAVAAGVAVACQVGKVPPSIPILRADLGIGLVTAGWIASIFNAVGAGFAVTAGTIADRLGHRRLLLVGIAAVAAGSLQGGLAAGPISLLIARFFEGIGLVFAVVAAPSIIAEAASPRHHRLVLSIWSAYLPAGMALMMITAPALLGALDWRGLWFVNAALLVAVAGLFAVFARGVGARPARRPDRAGLKAALARPGPWLLAGCFACYTIQFYGLATWLPTLMAETMGQSSAAAATLTGVVIAINVVGNLTGGWLLQRGVPRWRLIALVSAGLGLLSLGIFAPGPAAAWKILMAFAFCLVAGALPASVISGVPAHSPSPAQVGAINGLIVQGANIGTLAGPPLLAALVIGFGGWQASGWLLLGAGAIGVLLVLALRGVERRL